MIVLKTVDGRPVLADLTGKRPAPVERVLLLWVFGNLGPGLPLKGPFKVSALTFGKALDALGALGRSNRLLAYPMSSSLRERAIQYARARRLGLEGGTFKGDAIYQALGELIGDLSERGLSLP